MLMGVEARPATPAEETRIPQDIIVPSDIAKPLGIGLKQLTADSMSILQLVLNHFNPKDEKYKLWAKKMKVALHKINTFVDNLTNKDEVRLVPFSGSYDFSFSEETSIKKENDNSLQPGAIVIDHALSSNIIGAIFHNLGTQLSFIQGYSSAINKLSSNEFTKERAATINEASVDINNRLEPYKTAHQIVIITDQDGNTTINPVYASSEQHPVDNRPELAIVS